MTFHPLLGRNSFLYLDSGNLRVDKVFSRADIAITEWMRRFGLRSLRYSLAGIFIFFGIVKPLGLSPASDLVTKTVYWFDPSWFVPFLGWWEVAIGVCLLVRPWIRAGIALMALQMAGTFLPLILLPDIVYMRDVPWLTLEGQYIVKNIVLITAALVVGSHVRDKKNDSW